VRTTCRKECNKYDLTDAQCFWLAHHNNWSKWFAISSPSPICYPSFSFMGGTAKKYITKLGCEKHFGKVTYWAPPLEIIILLARPNGITPGTLLTHNGQGLHHTIVDDCQSIGLSRSSSCTTTVPFSQVLLAKRTAKKNMGGKGPEWVYVVLFSLELVFRFEVRHSQDSILSFLNKGILKAKSSKNNVYNQKKKSFFACCKKWTQYPLMHHARWMVWRQKAFFLIMFLYHN
jgi:hypothetical protein